MDEPYCGLWQPGIAWVRQWNPDPAAWALLALAVAMVLAGRRARRGPRLLALAVAALLWLSPLCPLSATLLSARVGHHVAVMLVFAPLAACAWPAARRWPVSVAGIAAVAAMVAWFVPAAYAWAWRSDAGYWLLQAAMALAAWQLWLGWFRAAAGDEREVVAATGALAMLALAMGMVAAVLAFAPRLLLVEHLLAAPLLGIDPLADQRIAGLAMWTLGMLPLGLVAALSLRGRLATRVASG